MNMPKRLQAIIVIIICAFPINGESQCFRGRPHCPEYSGATWQNYMQGKLGDATRAFSICFDHLKAAIGTLKPNTCYTVAYEGGQWTTTGQDDSGRTTRPPSFGGTDPGQLLMNIRGRIMKYNNFGQVIDPEFGLVGALKCGIGPSCG